MSHSISRRTSRTAFAFSLVFAGVLALSACVTDSEDPAPTPPPSRQMLIDTGSYEYMNCSGCHGNDGEGGRGPRLANSDYVMGSKERLISTVLAGLQTGDTIYVNGVLQETGGMGAWYNALSDMQIAGILTYIRVVLNDSLYTNCVPIDQYSADCDVNPRNPQDIATDSITVEHVAHIRDSLSLPPPGTE